MSTATDLEPIFEEAKALLEERESLLGDSWRTKGNIRNAMSQIFRKQRYLESMFDNKKTDDPRFTEDLKDLMNWCAMALWFVKSEKETK